MGLNLAPHPYRLLVLAVLVALAVLAGIVVALRVNITSTATPAQEGEALVSDIVIGVLRDPLQEGQPNPLLRQKQVYDTDDRLALRVTTTAAVLRPFTMRARLIDIHNPQGNVGELEPNQITLQPGASTFCCWTVTKPGSFNLQLFRPEGTVTSISLQIQQVFSAPSVAPRTPLPL